MGAVVLDLDPQASACRWRDRREAAFPVVTDVAPARLRPTLDAARARRVATVVLDTPPRSETAALEAARAADLVVVPCRPQIVDLEDGADDDPAARPGARSPRRGRARRGPAPWAAGRPGSPCHPGSQPACLSAYPRPPGRLGRRQRPRSDGWRVPAGRAAVELRRVVEWLTLLVAQPQLPEASDVGSPYLILSRPWRSPGAYPATGRALRGPSSPRDDRHPRRSGGSGSVAGDRLRACWRSWENAFFCTGVDRSH